MALRQPLVVVSVAPPGGGSIRDDMSSDPIVEQLHKQREDYMERFHYDLDAITRDIRAREAATAGPLLPPSPTPPPEPPFQRARAVRR